MTKDEAFARLAKSKFRSRFKMAADDLAYIERVGLETIRRHTEDFVREKLGPADPRFGGDGPHSGCLFMTFDLLFW